MIPSPPDSPPTPKEALPDATTAARGCLFVSGCGGSFVMLLIVFILALQAAGLLESWVTGEPVRLPHVKLNPVPLAWAWLIVSWAGYRGMRNRIRHPWVYCAVVVSLAGWCWFSFITDVFTITVGDKHLTDSRQIGHWIATILTSLVFLRFSLNQQNLTYFRVIAPPPDAPLPDA